MSLLYFIIKTSYAFEYWDLYQELDKDIFVQI